MKKAHSNKKNKGKLSSNKVSDGVTKTKDWPYLIIVAFLGKSIILLLVLIYIHVSSFVGSQYVQRLSFRILNA